MCIEYDIDYPGGAFDLSGQILFPNKWMGYCAEECEKMAECDTITTGTS